jgi:hypothetical protein
MMRGPVFGIENLSSRQQIRVQGVALRLLKKKRSDSAATAI